MSSNALTISGVHSIPSKVGEQIPAKKALFFGLVLATFQALDGILTSIGIDRYGPQAEGNPLLRSLIEDFGHIPTLTVIKLTAIIVVALLTVLTVKLPWINKAMYALTGIYFFSAIVPWTYILFIKPVIGA